MSDLEDKVGDEVGAGKERVNLSADGVRAGQGLGWQLLPAVPESFPGPAGRARKQAGFADLLCDPATCLSACPYIQFEYVTFISIFSYLFTFIMHHYFYAQIHSYIIVFLTVSLILGNFDSF